MALNDYAKHIADLIKSRQAKMDFQRLMYRIYVLAEIAEGERAIEHGHWHTQKQVMEGHLASSFFLFFPLSIERFLPPANTGVGTLLTIRRHFRLEWRAATQIIQALLPAIN